MNISTNRNLILLFAIDNFNIDAIKHINQYQQDINSKSDTYFAELEFYNVDQDRELYPHWFEFFN